MDSSGESKVNYIQVPQLPSKPHELYLCPSLSFSVPSRVCLFVCFSFMWFSVWVAVGNLLYASFTTSFYVFSSSSLFLSSLQLSW